MKIHHIGYAVREIEKSLQEFEKLGFKRTGNKIVDEDRNVMIQFIKLGHYSIELIAPLHDNSPVKKILQKCGEMPYHICYLVNDIERETQHLVQDKYLLIEQSKRAVAIESKKVAFLFKKGVGIIELVEE